MKKLNVYLTSFFFTILIGVMFAQASDMSPSVASVDTKQTLQTFPKTLPPSFDGPEPVAFSPDGNALATIGEDGEITLWDVTTGQMLWTQVDALNDSVTELVFSKDGKTLASTGKSAINLWNVASGQKRMFVPIENTDTAMEQVVFSPDGKCLAGVIPGKGVLLWDVKGKSSKLIQISPKNIVIDGLSFSPDGKYLVGATNGSNPKIKLWDSITGQLHAALATESAVTDFTFSPDGKILVSVNKEPGISLWSPHPGAVQRVLDANENITAIAVSPNSKILAIGSGGGNPKIQLWNLDTGKLVFTHSAEGGVAVVGLFYRPDGTRLASLGKDNHINLWDVSKGKLQQLNLGQVDEVSKIAFNTKQPLLATIGKDRRLTLWDLATGMEQQSFQVTNLLSQTLTSPQAPFSAGTSSVVTSKLITANTTSVASDSVITDAANLTASQTNSGKIKKRSTQKWKGIKALAISLDGTEMGTGSADGTLRIFKKNGSPRWNVSSHHGKAVAALGFRGRAKQWVSVGRDTEIKTWDDITGNNLQTFYGPEHPPRAVAVSPDGRYIATAGEETRVFLFDAVAGKLSKILSGHVDFVNALAFSPDGQTLASAGSEGRTLLWDVNTGKHLRTLLGHSSEVNAVAFSPDGALLATASEDSTVILSSLTADQPSRILTGHQGSVRSVAFSPNGKKLVSAGVDTRMLVWDSATGLLKKQLAGPPAAINVLVFDPAGNLHVGSENSEVSEINTDTGTTVETIVVPVPVTSTVAPQVSRSETLSLATASNLSELTSPLVVEKPSTTNVKQSHTTLNSIVNQLLDWVIPAANAALPDPNQDQGPGGSILIVTNGSPSFGKYYAEILRTEGLNEFAVADISTVTPTTLAAYDVVILAEMPLNAATQIPIFVNWVNGGGNLIAMRPDKDLASLLGLTDASSTLDNGYLLVNTSAAPGSGIVGETMQFHGTADRYTLSGATSIATLYSSAATATVNPAVTLKNAGSGKAAAFTYDLAKSIVYTRQGNPAWAAQERDGFTPIRSDDKFFGQATGDPQVDWIDFTKIAIPQGDEQQRLLANLILEMNRNKKPLPRFWYFPLGFKAAVIMTGDDHGNNGTQGRFDYFISHSTPGCSVQNWGCVRGTSYMYPNTPLAVANAASYNAQGFELGLHINTNCSDWTPATLDAFYVDQISTWEASFPGLPAPITQRHHCIAWSDWVTGAKIELNHSIRLDTSYYFWPPSWLLNRPGFFTGSGMPMRFSDLDGTLIDVYNATSQMTDESGQAYPFTVDTLLNSAVGTQGYYGAFTINAHTDVSTEPESETTVASAQAHGVPIITSLQMMNWLDYRNSSSFSAVTWSGNALNFTVTAGIGSANVPVNGLQVLLPMQSSVGVLANLTLNGIAVTFSTTTVKGVDYAAFSGVAGNFVATYAADTTPPIMTSKSPSVGATGVSQAVVVTATFSEAINPATINSSTFELRDSSNNLTPISVSYNANTHTASMTPSTTLVASATYTATVKGGTTDPRVKDLAGNALATSVIWSFTTETQPCSSSSCSAWSSSTIPNNPSVNDPGSVELGVKFRSDLNGSITGVRFYQANTGTTFQATLWNLSGQQLATGSVTSTASGWQQVNFSTPVAILANTVYVASYHAPNGNYAASNSPQFSTAGVDNPPIHLLQDGVSGFNGLYAYGTGSIYPTNSYQSSNYWVDAVFSTTTGSDTTPPTVAAQSPTPSANGVATNTVITATFSEVMDTTSITTASFELRGPAPANALIPATVAYNAGTLTATLTPTAALSNLTAYTATVKGGATNPRVKDTAGNAMTANSTWTFTTAAGGATGCSGSATSIWLTNPTPSIITDSDISSVELGVKFRSNVNGSICGIRFYKGGANVGTHIGTLWSSAGQQLAQATFTNETASGWQQVLFAAPVNITANTVYVASYHATVGRYSADNNGLAVGVNNLPISPTLYAFSSSESGGNGVYLYGSGGFPTNTFQSTNYWVDVLFIANTGPDTTPPTVISTAPVASATGVIPTNPVTVTFSEAMTATSITDSTFQLQDPSNAIVSASVTYNAGTNTATLVPTSTLAVSTTYTASVIGGASGVKDSAGNSLAVDKTWSFTTGVDPCTTGGNPIVCENSKVGNPPSEWDISGAGDPSVQGYATDISVNRGQTVGFKIDTPATSYRLDIYRMGYYGGNGARKVATVQPTVFPNQPACLTHSPTGLIDCGNWIESASWLVPVDAVSGIYFAKVIRDDGVNTGASHIVFIVRDDTSTADILFQTSDTTWQAYNNYGGNSFYTGTGPGTGGSADGRAYKVSYNRPFNTRAVDGGQDWVFNAEYPMVRWLEANGYNVSYFTGVDSDRRGNLIRNHKLFLSNGHDEYWSGQQRTNVEVARDTGVNPVHLAFFSGNEVFWKTRWENNITNSSGVQGLDSYRTLVCYKETHNFDNNPDPQANIWTGTWRDPRSLSLIPPKDGGRPENALIGTIFMVNDGATTSINVPEADGKMRFWRNTSIANLTVGTSAALPLGTLGYEWDEDLDNGFRPAGLVRLSTTIVPNAPILTDNGSTFGSGTANHALTLYKAPSGARVFGAGTVQWAWGLDSNHDRTVTPTNAAMQQATVNLFADMGIQPATIQAGLSVAAVSTDTTPPVSTIVFPATGATIVPSSAVTINGTATDTGGKVGGIEVSVDNGLTWHPATGRSNWSYAWVAPSTVGSITIRSRAVDDSLNLQATSTAINVNINTSSGATPPTAVSDTFLFRASLLRTINYSGALGLGVLANDTDTTNLPLSAQVVGSLPTGVTLTANGVVTVNRTTNTSVNYRANNGSQLSLPTTGALANLRLDGVPTTVAENCTYNRAGTGTVASGSACAMTGARIFSMNLIANDTDPNVTTNVPSDGVGDAVTGAIITATGAAVAVSANAVCGQTAIVKTATLATITNNCNGTVTVTVAAAAPATPINLTYRALDDLGAQSATRNDVVTVQ